MSLFCCADLPWKLYSPICLLKLTYQPLSLPRNYLLSFSLLSKAYLGVATISYMHTYFPLAYKPINIWQPFRWSSWPTLSTHPWYYSWWPSPPFSTFNPMPISSFITPYLKQVDKRPSISRALKTQMT